MNTLDESYKNLVLDCTSSRGTLKQRRNGPAFSLWGVQLRHRMSDGFPLLTHKKMAWKQIVAELIWFLGGDSDLKKLWAQDCHIWDDDSYNYYLTHNPPIKKDDWLKKVEKADTWPLGTLYPELWRGYRGVDQIATLKKNIREDPESSRHLVVAWDPATYQQMALPPCHYSFQVNCRPLSQKQRNQLLTSEASTVFKTLGRLATDEELDKLGVKKYYLDLAFLMRSSDLGLGLPFNLASYGLLLEILATELNMLPGDLVYTAHDAHVYLPHVNPLVKNLEEAVTYHLPTLELEPDTTTENLTLQKLTLCGYQSGPKLKLPLIS